MIAAVAATIPGCAELPRPPLLPAEARVNFRHLTVETKFSGTAGAPEEPVKGAGAGAGAGALQGTVGMLFGGGGGAGLLLGVVLAPVGFVGGALIGAANARSAEEVEAAQGALSAALAAAQPAEALRTRVAALLVSEAGVVVADSDDTSEGNVGGTGDPAGAPGVLDLAVDTFRVATLGTIDPTLTVAIGVTGRLWRPGDGAFIYLRGWSYESEERAYFALSADGAAGMRRLLDAAFDTIAKKIVEDLFVNLAPPEERIDKGVARADFAVVLDGERSLIELDPSCLHGGYSYPGGLSLVGEAADGSSPAHQGFLVVEPAMYTVGVLCVPEAIESSTLGFALCGQLQMNVLPGMDYRIILAEPGRVTALDARTGEVVADGVTWQAETGWFVKKPCTQPAGG